MSSQFYQELARLDLGIADRWKKVTKDNTKFIIDERAAITILGPVLNISGKNLKTHKITKGQADAVVKLLERAQFSSGLRDALAALAFEAVELGYFVRGASSPLDITVVKTALGQGNVGKIKFYSPGSEVSYTPILYEGVLDLITRKDSEVTVKEVHAAGLNVCSRCSEKKSQLGGYVGNVNELTIYTGMSPAERTVLVVHEATHVIQDWSDKLMSHFHAEADAYIAGGIVALGMGADVFKATNRYGGLLETAAGSASRGYGTADNKTWKESYNDLVNVISQDPLYKEKKGVRFVPNEPKRAKGPEAVEWQKTLDKLKSAKKP